MPRTFLCNCNKGYIKNYKLITLIIVVFFVKFQISVNLQKLIYWIYILFIQCIDTTVVSVCNKHIGIGKCTSVKLQKFFNSVLRYKKIN